MSARRRQGHFSWQNLAHQIFFMDIVFQKYQQQPFLCIGSYAAL
jgi:hypothetical protein